eukprot:Rhum_TRINITY_DN16590_c0_g1::Rhum_TRINITY_DN16590_c0_g1_i1::g.163743::m.163743
MPYAASLLPLLCGCALFGSAAYAMDVDSCVPEQERIKFPRQFTAHVSVLATGCQARKQKLADEGKEVPVYPPCVREAKVAFDSVAKRARLQWTVDWEPVNRTYIRRYDLGREYELKTVCFDDDVTPPAGGGDEDERRPSDAATAPAETCESLCARSELDERILMPMPAYFYEEGEKLPETITFETAYNVWTAVDIVAGPPDAALFVVPHHFEPETNCKVVGQGFSYVHFFDNRLTV